MLRSRKCKREGQNCLSPYREIFNDLVRTSKQTKITDFLKRIESAKNLNEEKGFKSEGDTALPKNRSRLIVQSSEEEEIY